MPIQAQMQGDIVFTIVLAAAIITGIGMLVYSWRADAYPHRVRMGLLFTIIAFVTAFVGTFPGAESVLGSARWILVVVGAASVLAALYFQFFVEQT